MARIRRSPRFFSDRPKYNTWAGINTYRMNQTLPSSVWTFPCLLSVTADLFQTKFWPFHAFSGLLQTYFWRSLDLSMPSLGYCRLISDEVLHVSPGLPWNKMLCHMCWDMLWFQYRQQHQYLKKKSYDMRQIAFAQQGTAAFMQAFVAVVHLKIDTHTRIS